MKLTSNFDPNSANSQLTSVASSFQATMEKIQTEWEDTFSYDSAIGQVFNDPTALSRLVKGTAVGGKDHYVYTVDQNTQIEFFGTALDKLKNLKPGEMTSNPGFTISEVKISHADGSYLDVQGSLKFNVVKKEVVPSVAFSKIAFHATDLDLQLSGSSLNDTLTFTQAKFAYQGVSLTATGKLVLDDSTPGTLNKIEFSGLSTGTGKASNGSMVLDFGAKGVGDQAFDNVFYNYWDGEAFAPFMPNSSLTTGDDDITWLLPTKSTSTTPTFHLGAGNDKLTLGTNDDVAYGDAGNDSLVGGAGNDSLYGDSLVSTNGVTSYSGNGNDTLIGGAGDDTLNGGAGSDLLDGGDGADWASYFGAGAAVTVNLLKGTATGGAGNDTLKSIEHVRGSDYADTLTGDAGDNFLQGGKGNDTLDGGAGSDWADYKIAGAAVTVDLSQGKATGADGTDKLSNIESVRGSNYDDTLTGDDGDNMLRGGLGNDTLDGGKGSDWADYKNAGAAVTVDLSQGQATGGDGTDKLSNIENVRGSSYDDKLTGDDGNNVLNGGLGNDTLDGGKGADWVSYKEATGAVTVNLNAGTATGADGSDTLSNIENILGSQYNDTLTGDGNANWLRGGLGNDTLDGGDGSDWADYRDASAAVTVDLSKGTATGADGADTLKNIENARGSASNDKLTGDNGNNRFRGGLGNDQIDGGAGTDTADYTEATGAVTVDLKAGTAKGADGNDTLKNIENILGSSYADTLTGGDGDNRIDGGAGNDKLTGGKGSDTFVLDVPGKGVDTITDFVHGTDKLGLMKSDFSLTANFQLSAANLLAGAGKATAETADHYIVYNSTTGDLYFDADGSGTASSVVKIAVIGGTSHPTLDISDFVLL